MGDVQNYSALAPPRSNVELPRGYPERRFGVHSLVSTSAGEVSGRMETGRWTASSYGTPVNGAIGVLLDDVLASTLMVRHRPGYWPITTELTIDFLRPVPVDESGLTAQGQCHFIDDEGGYAIASVFDSSADTVATGTSWLKFIEAAGTPERLRPETLFDTAPDASPATFPQSRVDGWRVFYPHDLGYVSPRGTVHGGIVLAMITSATERFAAQDGSGQLESVRVTYTRPSVGDLVAEVEEVHRGRSLRLYVVRVRLESGKLAAYGTVVYRRSPQA